MNYVLAKPDSPIVYPYPIWKLREDNPNFSIPGSVTEEDLALFDCFTVVQTALPNVDIRTKRFTESDPLLNAEGKWEQTWEVRDATPEEIQEWDSLHTVTPTPDWTSFKLLFQGSPDIKTLLKQALIDDPANALSLQIELNEVIRGGDARPFYAALTSVFTTVSPPPEIIQTFVSAAQVANLPKDFISGLSNLLPPVEQPVTDSAPLTTKRTSKVKSPRTNPQGPA